MRKSAREVRGRGEPAPSKTSKAWSKDNGKGKSSEGKDKGKGKAAARAAATISVAAVTVAWRRYTCDRGVGWAWRLVQAARSRARAGSFKNTMICALPKES